MIRGDRVRELREKLDLSQRELGEKVGISQGSISRIENNGSDDVMESTLQGLAQALQTSTAYLCGDTDDPSPRAHTAPIAEPPRHELFERALGVAFRKHPHAEVRDLDATRALFLSEPLPPLANLDAAVDVVLSACVTLRTEQRPTTLHSVLMQVLQRYAASPSASSATATPARKTA
jgi:transcriptional regulator with XRE-family HTH domain